MSWLANLVRPKLQALTGKRDVPDNLWHKCPSCSQMIFHRDLAENMQVCPHCSYHFRFTPEQRFQLLFDAQRYQRHELPKVIADPLKFRDRKRYADRIKEARDETKVDDALQVASGSIFGVPALVAVMDFSFMAGSMGMAVGQGIVKACEIAVQHHWPLIMVTSSGGARMQEGILSLMQMPRTTIGVQMLRQANLPYVVVLADPTTGGVSASFAMLGDITFAEPGATIGFAGARVIKETIRQELPAGFQKAEYLLDHGMVDRVLHRKDMKKELAQTLSMLMQLPRPNFAMKDEVTTPIITSNIPTPIAPRA